MSEQKKHVADIDRSMYDFKDKDTSKFKAHKGLTPEIIRKISAEKHDPAWMLDFRLKSLELYNKMPLPNWGPSLEDLDMDDITTYVQPDTKMKGNWKEVPDDIKNTFERLGIPKAERDSLAGVGAQYDSEVVYHNVKDEVTKQGVVYTDMESALTEHEDLIHEYFMKLVPPTDHKFIALHGAVWSGGSFVYVPEGVHVSIPLQSYFRLNAPGAGQFEHTLIIVEKNASLHFIEGCSAPKYNVTNLHAGCVELFVKEGAHLRYSTIENWSKNMMNLNTKRALIEKDASIEWVSGSFGSHVSMLYPMSILNGEGAHSEFTGITFAGKGQNLDTGTRVVHAAPHTYSTVNTKSISKDGGACIYRSGVEVRPNAYGSRSSVSCESLMLDAKSRSDTVPVMDIRNDDVDVGHEARIGRISEDSIFYLMARGLSEEDARALIVRGFAEPVAKELPLEYAVEMNNLIKLEMEGSIS
ncbi:MAG TPA: Fe-S cluster assembly protein SufB [Ruminococcaceae bacterium]|nr:Fe-S cluster assembly protein SufB [Oscillospiraceae bacterium]